MSDELLIQQIEGINSSSTKEHVSDFEAIQQYLKRTLPARVNKKILSAVAAKLNECYSEFPDDPAYPIQLRDAINIPLGTASSIVYAMDEGEFGTPENQRLIKKLNEELGAFISKLKLVRPRK